MSLGVHHSEHGHQAGNPPSPEHLLVFYIPDAANWQATVAHIESKGIMPVAADNPYWDQQVALMKIPMVIGL
jgi:hypothetical protein